MGKGHAFTGKTSYAQSYPRRPPVKPIRVDVNDNDSTLTDAVAGLPFEAQSSYRDHYVRHTDWDPRSSARPARSMPESRPFAGCSEYRNKFMQSAEPTPRLRLQLM